MINPKEIGNVYMSDDSENLFVIKGANDSNGFPLSLMRLDGYPDEWIGMRPTPDKILITYEQR